MMNLNAKTNHKMNRQEFEILKTTMKNTLATLHARKIDSSYYANTPCYLGLKLTNACNLRCKHCYQWNETGYHRFMDSDSCNAEIPLEIIEKLLNETEEKKSRLYLWGGEPLLYSEFARLCDQLGKYDREVAICTNLLLADRYMEAFGKINKLELLIGMEGPELIHDSIRGKGNFVRVISLLDQLVERKRRNLFHGKLSVHTMLSDSLRDCLYDYLCFLEDRGIEMVILCFPWFIGAECKTAMDSFYSEYCTFLPSYASESRHSWYSFNYNFHEEYVQELMLQFDKIAHKHWKMIIRYQPDLQQNEIGNFIAGRNMDIGKKCLAVSERMEVNPDCTVSACKFFDEFVVGSLKEQSLSEIWNSDIYCHFRQLIAERQMPVCTKCSELYLHGIVEN